MAAVHELIVGFALSNEVLLHHGPSTTSAEHVSVVRGIPRLILHLSIPPTRERVMLKVWWSLGNQSH
jgi:hypothetical protein